MWQNPFCMFRQVLFFIPLREGNKILPRVSSGENPSVIPSPWCQSRNTSSADRASHSPGTALLFPGSHAPQTLPPGREEGFSCSQLLPSRLLLKPEEGSALNTLRVRAPQGKLPEPFPGGSAAGLCRKLLPWHSRGSVCSSAGFTLFCYFYIIYEINWNSMRRLTTNITTCGKKNWFSEDQPRGCPQHWLETATHTQNHRTVKAGRDLWKSSNPTAPSSTLVVSEG